MSILYNFSFHKMANLSYAEAREYIDSIREENGGIEDSDRDKTPKSVLKALESVRKQLAASTEMYQPGHFLLVLLSLLTIVLTDLPPNSTQSHHDLFMSLFKTQRITATLTPKPQGWILFWNFRSIETR